MASPAEHFNSSPVRPKYPNLAVMASWIRLQQWTSPGTRSRLSALRRRWPMSTSPAGPCASICCPTRIRWRFCSACAGHRGSVSTTLRPRSAGRKTSRPVGGLQLLRGAGARRSAGRHDDFYLPDLAAVEKLNHLAAHAPVGEAATGSAQATPIVVCGRDRPRWAVPRCRSRRRITRSCDGPAWVTVLSTDEAPPVNPIRIALPHDVRMLRLVRRDLAIAIAIRSFRLA